MSVSVSGAVLSALLYEQSNCTGDQEGFLLGKVIKHVTDSISDSQINNRKEETVTYVYNYIPVNSPFSWYDHAGRVNQDRLKAILGKHKKLEVIGWYRWRRQSTLSPSLREKAMHRALIDTFHEVSSEHFIFSLFSTSISTNHSTHSFDYIFQVQKHRQFAALPVTLVNLKDTSQADYKLQANHNIDTVEGIYAETLKKARPQFLDVGVGNLRQVQAIQNLNLKLYGQLQDLYTTVSTSEEKLGSLTTEVEQLRERWKRKRYPVTAVQKDALQERPRRETVVKNITDTASEKNDTKARTEKQKHVSRQQSKQEEIMEDLKDLLIEPSPTATPPPTNLMDLDPIMTPNIEMDENPTGAVNNVTPAAAGIGIGKVSRSDNASSSEDILVEKLQGSPVQLRRGRAAKLNNAVDPGKNTSTKASAPEKPQKKADAFDFVSNLVEEAKRNKPAKGTNTRKAKAQSMIMDSPVTKSVTSKRRSLTPTRESNSRANNKQEKTTPKASTLPPQIGSPAYDESADDDLPSSPTY